MPKVLGSFSVQRRSKKNKSFIITINQVESGLPPEICQKWQRRSFAYLPAELSHFRYPTSEVAADNGAKALIELLKKEVDMGNVWRYYTPLLIENWMERFISLDNNPRAERIIAQGIMYSQKTIDVYASYYNRYIKSDPFLNMDINKVDVPAARAFVARIGMKKTSDGRTLVGKSIKRGSALSQKEASARSAEMEQMQRSAVSGRSTGGKLLVI